MKNMKLFEDFWGTEGSGILPYCLENEKFLIGKRSFWVKEPHTWSLFGGAIGLNMYGEEEEKLSPEDNAIKEFKEESNFNDKVKLYPMVIYSKPNFTYYNYLGMVDKYFKPISTDDEVEEFMYLTPKELFENKFDLKYHFGLEYLLNNCIKDIKKIIYTT